MLEYFFGTLITRWNIFSSSFYTITNHISWLTLTIHPNPIPTVHCGQISIILSPHPTKLLSSDPTDVVNLPCLHVSPVMTASMNDLLRVADLSHTSIKKFPISISTSPSKNIDINIFRLMVTYIYDISLWMSDECNLISILNSSRYPDDNANSFNLWRSASSNTILSSSTNQPTISIWLSKSSCQTISYLLNQL